MHLTCKRAPVLPKIRILSFEITGAFDLFLNTDLCECVFPSVDNGMKKVKRLAEPEMWLRSQCRGCCVEWNSAQAHKCTVCCTQFPHMFTLIHAENIHTCTLATSSSFFNILNRCSLETKQVLPVWMIISGSLEWLSQGILSLFTHIDLLVTIVQMNVRGENWKQLSLTQHGVWFLSQVKQMLCSFYP